MKLPVICIVLLLSPAVLGSFSPEVSVFIHEYERDCASESGVSGSSVESFRKDRKIPDEPQANNFAKCMLQKFNVMSPNGVLNPDVSSYGIPRDTNGLMLLAPTCLSLQTDVPTETANKFMNCLLGGYEMALAHVPNPLL